MNNKVGKHGEKGFRPKETITGRTLGKKSQIFITRSLGDGYYVVVDPGIIPNLEELIDEVKEGLPSEPKRKKHIVSSGQTDTTI